MQTDSVNSDIPMNDDKRAHSVFSATGYNTFQSNIYFFATILLFFLSIALVRFIVGGVPVRSLFVIALFFGVFAPRPQLLIDALKDTLPILLVITYAGLLGLIVSLYNSLPVPDVLRQIVELHIQAIIGVLTGYGLLHVIGARKLVYAFVIVVGVSGLLAIFQAMGIGVAWDIRSALQSLQSYALEHYYLDERARAMGLSFTPVHLATQICLAFAAFFVLRKGIAPADDKKLFAWSIWIALFATVFISIISGNRSPILGCMVFAGCYVASVRPALLILGLFILLPAGLMIYSNLDAILTYMQNTDIRAFRIGDKSSVGREALRDYGWLLFTTNPFGYGLIFDSTSYVPQFWDQMALYENAETIKGNAIHNYYLNMLHKYGVFILPLAAYLLIKVSQHYRIALGFLPYAVQSFFHNDGPLYGDFMIWYFLPVCLYAVDMRKIRNTAKE